MCTGVEIALVAGAVLAAAGTAYTGVQQAQQADTQAGIMAQQARSERQAAAAAEADFRRQQSREMGRRRAMMGGTGVDPSSGSSLLATEDFAAEVELGALRIRHGGQVGATRLEQQAAMERARGRAEQTGGFIRSGSLLLSGAGNTYYGSA